MKTAPLKFKATEARKTYAGFIAGKRVDLKNGDEIHILEDAAKEMCLRLPDNFSITGKRKVAKKGIHDASDKGLKTGQTKTK